MSVKYEIPSNDSFIMEVNFIDCKLDSILKDKIFDYLKNEKMLLGYLRKVLEGHIDATNQRLKEI